MTLRRMTALFCALAVLFSFCLPAAASGLTWPQEMLGIDAAQSRGITGEGIVIGIIDSGLSDVFADHSDATVLEGVNYLVAEDHADRHDVTDNVGHGTAVASIIADREIGLAPDVTLVSLKCFDKQTSTFAAITEAVYDAVDLFSCDVINLSLGAAIPDDSLTEAVQYALDRDVIVIAAVGNRSSYSPSTGSDPYFYPAAQEGVISVGAVDSTGSIYYKSTQNDRLFMTAPGYQVPILNTSGVHTTGSGTSYASPYVAAAAALLLSAVPELTASDVSELFRLTSADLGTAGFDVTYGHGLLNVEALLAAALDETPQVCFDSETAAVSGYAYPHTALPYTMHLTFYQSHGQFHSIKILTGLTGVSCFSDIPIPDGCTDFKCFVTDTDSAPIMNMAQIKTESP